MIYHQNPLTTIIHFQQFTKTEHHETRGTIISNSLPRSIILNYQWSFIMNIDILYIEYVWIVCQSDPFWSIKAWGPWPSSRWSPAWPMPSAAAATVCVWPPQARPSWALDTDGEPFVVKKWLMVDTLLIHGYCWYVVDTCLSTMLNDCWWLLVIVSIGSWMMDNSLTADGWLMIMLPVFIAFRNVIL